MALYDVSDSAKKANPVLVGGGTLYADMPVASEVKFDGTEIPSAFLACDGSTFSATIYPELAEALGGTTLPTNSGYIIKAKSEAIPTSFLAKVDEAVELLHNGVYILLSTTLTTTATDYTLTSGRKLSDYDYLIFQQCDGTSIRNEMLVYPEQFKTKRVILSALHGTNSAEASEYSVSTTNVQYIDDTTVRCYLTGSSMLSTIEVLGVKLAK